MKGLRTKNKILLVLIVVTVVAVATMHLCVAGTLSLSTTRGQEVTAPTLTEDSVYSVTGRVVWVSPANDTVTFEDSIGDRWEFKGVGIWKPNDCVSATMNTMGTPSVYDDEVINVTYNAWVLERPVYAQ